MELDPISDPIFLVLLPLGVISVVLYIPAYFQRRRIKKIEYALSEALNELTDCLKGGSSLEYALKDIAERRKDPLGKELQLLLQDLKEYRLEDALKRFAARTGSAPVKRVISIINIASETSANLADVLKMIAEELWRGYMLEKEREAKIGSYSFLSLFGASVLIPGIIGFILGAFHRPEFGATFASLIPDFKIFVIALSLCGVIMSGCIQGKLKQAFIIAPFFVLISYATFIGMIIIIPKLLGIGS
jgi:hypothetical protein